MYQSSTSSSNNYIVTQDVSYKTDSSITVSITRQREGGGIDAEKDLSGVSTYKKRTPSNSE